VKNKISKIKQQILSNILFLFLKKLENNEELEKILQRHNWFMTSVHNDINKRCDVYKKDNKFYFKNYDNTVYKLDLTMISQFLVKK